MTENDIATTHTTPDAAAINLLLGIPPDEDIIFANYLDYAANDGLLPYKATIHYGTGKPGESLYTHILNGIGILDQVRRLLSLTDTETQVLFTAYTLHDINKMETDGDIASYRNLAVRERVEPKISDLRLNCFFPEYESYLEDMLLLMRQHSRHHFVGTPDMLDLRRAGRYGLDMARLKQLIHLIRGADNVDLSDTLEEQRHKDIFLYELNVASETQYTFVRHRIAEQRGSFTNIMHNATIAVLKERFGLVPLLLYPEGVAYLCPRGQEPAMDETLFSAIAARAAEVINTMNSEGFESFIEPANMGIKIDRKCLELGIPFARLFGVVEAKIEKRAYKADKREQLARDALRRTREAMAKGTVPLEATPRDTLEALLEAGPVPQTAERLRVGELLRTYYIFVKEHFSTEVADPWHHLYQMLDIPPERQAVYALFEARLDRAYAVAAGEALPNDEIRERITADGDILMQRNPMDDPRQSLLYRYGQQVIVLDGQTAHPDTFAAALPNYIQQKHHQCVQCSLPLPTMPWISGDVRSDIKVNVFSNRLRGGPGEPKKQICGICQMQFLAEKLNYPEVRGEQTVYLHMFPYSFQTEPFVQGLRQRIQQITQQDMLALRIDALDQEVHRIANGAHTTLNFATRTKENKAQPFGIYMPRYSETMGGVMTLPINAAGDNDTEKFLFVVQYALLLQRHFGSKVLVSAAVTPPLAGGAFDDVYFDLTPLSCRGLIRQNNYREYKGDTQEDGTLRHLHKQLRWLHAIQHHALTRTNKPLVELVQAMAVHPLRVFYAAEKLAEERAGKSGSAGWTMQAIANDVRELALSIGETEMTELDTHLQRLAKTAWQGHLRGKSLEKNSLMAPMNEVLRKVALLGPELNVAVVQSAATQELYDHIERIHQSGGKRLFNACEDFTRIFFDDIFHGVYQGRQARLLHHEKTLRSAFHFYIRKQIPSKTKASDDGTPDDGTPEDGTPDEEMNHRKEEA